MCYMLWQYAANMMILFIVSSAAFCLLLITYASSHPNKVQLLAVLSLTIIACNFINKWQTEHIPLLAVPTASPDIRKVTPARIKLTLAEQRQVNSLSRALQDQKHLLVHIKGLTQERLGCILSVLADRNSANRNEGHLYTLSVSFDQANTTPHSNTLSAQILQQQREKQGELYLWANADELRNQDQLYRLIQLYLSHNISVLLFGHVWTAGEHRFDHMIQTLPFEDDYRQLLADEHSPQLVEVCREYRTMDYRFYLAAKQQSLLSLCTKDLPSNAATNCLQQQMTHPHDTVLLSQASSCFDPRYPPEGVLMNAGRVWLLKDYYWAGRVRKEVFSRFGDDL